MAPRATPVDRAPAPLLGARALARSARPATKTIDPEQPQLALSGQLGSVYGHRFILTDIAEQPAAALEDFHRQRAQIEERLKDAKLGQALRRPPCADINANRVWLTAVVGALNLSAMPCDRSPLARASGTTPEKTPLRRHAKTLRRTLPRVPARITRHARRTTLRLAAGYRHISAPKATWTAAYALPPPQPGAHPQSTSIPRSTADPGDPANGPDAHKHPPKRRPASRSGSREIANAAITRHPRTSPPRARRPTSAVAASWFRIARGMTAFASAAGLRAASRTPRLPPLREE